MFTFPNRGKEYKSIDVEITSELAGYSSDDLIDMLDKKLVMYQQKLANVANELDRVRYEIYIDIYKKHLEDFLETRQLYDVEAEKQLWQGYPELTDQSFNLKIFNKKEFRNHIIEKQPLVLDPPKSSHFKRTPSQEFVSTYLSPFTPYNGLLLWHGVGVGKTCAAISSAENYRRYGNVHGKIMILVPNDSLIQGWKDEIFSIKKEANNKKNVNVQCTGNTFKDELGNFGDLTLDQKTRRVNKLIDKYYEFMGYRSFSNMIRREMEDILKGRTDKERFKIEYIRRKFSDRVFILDEVHFTRQYASGAGDENKDIAMFLEMIARYGENNKFILASATPMYNSSEEIISIINILLLNDKRAPIETSDVFETDGYTLKPGSENILENKTRGYISFLRGENPLVFPVKIYPELPGLSYVPNPKYYYKKGELVLLPEELKIDHLSFIKSPMSPFQYKFYKKTVVGASDDGDIRSDKFSIPSTLASNMMYPVDIDNNGELVGLHGDDGFNESFEIQSADKENKSNVRYRYRPIARMSDGIPFLDEKHLGRFSKKFFNIFQIVKNSEGIVFIYSKYLLPGVETLALMFEQNGYKKFSPGDVNINMLEQTGGKERCYCGKLRGEHSAKKPADDQDWHPFKQGAYIMLTGETKQKELVDLISEARDRNNINAERIKIILGTNRIEQGVNFFNIREVHIVDPWHHFNRTEQVVGRAIRQKSHKDLPPSKRNVSVYLHCASIPETDAKIDDLNIETTDEKTYRHAYFKSKRIAEVTRIIKRNAVDCLLNKNGNQLTIEYFGNVENKIITSQKIPLRNEFFGDRDGDVICDYQKCNYDCTVEPITAVVPKPNEDTYNDILSIEDISEAKNLISILFQIKGSYTMEEIRAIKNKNFQRISDNFIYQAINDYVYFQEPIYDSYFREGRLIYRNGYYLFQPFELNESSSSLIQKSVPLNYRPLDYILSEIDPNLIRASKKSFNIEIREPIEEAVTIAETSRFIESIKQYISQVKDYIHHDNVYGRLGNPSKSSFRLQQRDISCSREGLIEIQDTTCSLPEQTILDMLEQYLIFSILDRLSFDNKVTVISYVLENNIKRGGFCMSDDLLETSVLRFYDKKCPDDKRYSIFRVRRDIEGPTYKGADLPKVFRLISPQDGLPVFYQYNDETGHFEATGAAKTDEYNERFPMPYDLLKINSDIDLVYGFVQDKERRATHTKKSENDVGIDSFHVDFYLINKRFHSSKKNKDNTIQHKSEIKGAVCGTALGAKDKPELIEILKYIIEINTDIDLNKDMFYDEFNIKQKVNSHTDPNEILRLQRDDKTYKFLTEKGSLCELIELVLRHKQYINPTGHWFFNYDEWCYLRYSKKRYEESQKKTEEEKKKLRAKPGASKKK